MQESPVKIDSLLEPLLTATSDEHADEVLSQLIAGHAEPVTAARNLADIENLPAHIRAPKELAEAVASILNYVGGPLEFDESVRRRSFCSGCGKS
jgi:hypothetical protein